MHIDVCKSGAESVELVRTNRYDIVFMDHMMPEMDGIEATAIIRNMENGDGYYQNVPIIALTANAVSGVKEMFLRNGMNDFLSKPIEITRLNSILEKWVPPEKQKKHYEAVREIDASNLKIAGIDVRNGISMTGGNFETYMETLKVFLSDGREKIQQIKTSIENKDLHLYTTYVHALKSAAASIGAQGLSDFARDLERAGKNEDTEFIEMNSFFFLTQLETLLQNIDDALSAYRQSGSEITEEMTDPLLFKSELSGLKDALENMNTGTADTIITGLQKMNLPQKAVSGIEYISHNVLLSDYEGAVAIIDELLGEI
ncbi:response regulator [Brucepastera parasyntrophica]|uniref:response regulator n=1 Tax=Brucepastera parasyntrophica TaxID=2880008 RepID=UPI00210A27D8|nr:response regulator [Brucepastera parasyntrophica]ULQ60565.1 response regulator [Brucepastera parasyntrophica]